MSYRRLPLKDPRTVAREIPSIFDVIFPQLTAGMVAYFNKRIVSYSELDSLPDDLIKESGLNHAMLFEVAYVRAEQLLHGIEDADWNECLTKAVARQRRHFDAKIPDEIKSIDKAIAETVGKNLTNILHKLLADMDGDELMMAPKISGYQWIASGNGDFSIGDKLIEVKCSSKNFGSADYRQILMYWLLSYATKIEHDNLEWKTGVLVNPRLNHILEIPFDDLIKATSAGKTKIEILELFSSIVGDYALKSLPEFRV